MTFGSSGLKTINGGIHTLFRDGAGWDLFPWEVYNWENILMDNIELNTPPTFTSELNYFVIGTS